MWDEKMWDDLNCGGNASCKLLIIIYGNVAKVLLNSEKFKIAFVPNYVINFRVFFKNTNSLNFYEGAQPCS